MKSLGFVLSYLANGRGRRSLRVFVGLLGLLVVMVAVFSVGFHWIMATEDQRYSWPTSVYWTLVTMSTLGFGDITFTSDLGRMFSVVVLLSGSVFILVLLPFTFIQFVFVPWMEARAAARAPRQLPANESGHVLLTTFGPIEEALIRRLDRAGVGYAVIEPDLDQALRLHDRGYRVMVGALDDPETYREARVGSASLLATTLSDPTNTNVAFTAREIAPTVPIAATASSAAAVDILELAGCDTVLQLGEMLGSGFADRVLMPGAASHLIGEFGELLVAEASVAGTPLVGQTLGQARLRERVSVNVVGVWNRGHFELASADTLIPESAVLVLSGTKEQLRAYDAEFTVAQASEPSAIIIGGGRVGRATGRQLAAAGIHYRIIERDESRVRDPNQYVVGDAADLQVLRAAGIAEAEAVVVTTHDDDTNVYLTLYSRRLRPGIQVLARANHDRNVSTLHRAGADVVLSYASTGATAIWNQLNANDTLLLAEGLDVFRVTVPAELAGRTLADSGIRQTTGCHVMALTIDGTLHSNPDASTRLPAGAELVLIGDTEAEHEFLTRYRMIPRR